MPSKKILIKLLFLAINVILFVIFGFINKPNLINNTNIVIIIASIIFTVLILVVSVVKKFDNKLSDLFDISSFITNIGAFLLILVTLILFNGRVDGVSMEPTLHEKNYVIASRTLNNINKEDIVIYKDSNSYIIKRVKATKGDKLTIINNELYINDIKLIDKNNVTYKLSNSPSSYKILNILVDSNEYVLKDNEYILLGDNANNSTDSRQKGLIMESSIIGKVRWWF